MYTLAPLDDNPNRAAAVVQLEDGPRCAVQALAQESPIYPVAAILAGPRPRPLPDGRYCVHVTAAFPARRLMRSDGIARFTAATWQDVKATLAELSRGGRVITLGVVMTHPGFGPWLIAEEACFLKGYLGQPFQVLAVLDAHRHVGAFYGWTRDMLALVKLRAPWPWRPGCADRVDGQSAGLTQELGG